MFDLVRSSLHRVITTPAGDRFLPVRLPKDLARRVNAVLGEPIASREEIARRRAARAKLAELADAAARGVSTAASAAPREAAPVMIYFEKDRNQRMLERIKDALEARGIAFTALDVAGDETTKDYVMREARVKDDELPVVFIAGTPVGGYAEVVEWDVSGRLTTAVWGATQAPKTAASPAKA